MVLLRAGIQTRNTLVLRGVTVRFRLASSFAAQSTFSVYRFRHPQQSRETVYRTQLSDLMCNNAFLTVRVKG